MKPLIAGSILMFLGVAAAAPVQAKEDWWFDVEVILFERETALSQLDEQFEFASDVGPVQADWDLISAYFHPDISWVKQGLTTCGTEPSPLWMKQPSVEQIIQQHSVWLAQQPESLLNEPEASSLSDDRFETAGSAETFGQTTNRPGSSSYSDLAGSVVSDRDIAGYWLSFFGPDNLAPVRIPEFRYCEPDVAWLSWSENGWHRYTVDNQLPYPSSIPIVLDGQQVTDATGPRILPSADQALEKMSQQIRWAKGITRMLHVVWRQPVEYGEKNAHSVRLFAGKNYQGQFDIDGRALTLDSDFTDDSGTESESLHNTTQPHFFERLNHRLEQARPVSFEDMMAGVNDPDSIEQLQELDVVLPSDSPIWQLDGNLKVFLKNINRVPYLHIDSELYFRQPVPMEPQPEGRLTPEYRLVSVPFKQIRRVVSNQLHYFDHPLFGMVVQIRRFKNPASFD